MQAVVVLVALLVAPAVIGLMVIPTIAQTDDPLPVINPTPAGIPEKFEEAFYEKILKTISKRSDLRSSGTTPQYYTVVVVVERYGPDGTDVSEMNKARIVEELKEAGAKDIASAETLSFVIASVPVDKIVGLSTHEEVHLLGDGQLPLHSLASNPAVTVNATVAALTTANGIADGSGARVAILEFENIDYSFVNDKIILSLDCGSHPCTPAGDVTSGFTHADKVAHFIGTTGHDDHNGISPGAEIISLSAGDTADGMYYALDWAVSNDVDVVSMSVGHAYYCSSSSAQFAENVISNDVVLSGTTLASSAGNQGPGYETLTAPCSYNTIAVGGIDDSGSDITMSSFASRGPYHIFDYSTRIATVMKPEIVAPATRVPVAVTDSRTTAVSGTSYSAPQVSAAVAVLAGENDYLSPEDVRATLFLGANWTGPVPCTSVQFEQNNAADDCSYARKPPPANATSISILNNVGFGILNVGQSLHYTLQGNGQHVVAGDLLHDDVLEYQFNITNTARPVKVILTWLNNAFNAVSVPGEAPTDFTSGRIYNLDLEVTCPGMGTIHANSAHQNNEFAVFMPNQTGTCTAQVNSSDSRSYDSRKRFALASTIPFNVEPTSPRISVTSPVNATVTTLAVDFGNAIKLNTFTASDVTTSTGTVSEPTTAGNQTFGFNITNTANKDVEISIAAGTVEYVSGNINAEAHARIERAPPTVVLSTIMPSPTNAQDATFTATFSEPVAFDSRISDISVTGGAASNLSPSGTASSFTFTVTPTGDGEVTVQIPADAASDVAGKGNVASAVSRLTFERTVPTVTSLTTNVQSPTNSTNATFTAVFSENVTFTGNILVTGGTADKPSGTASSFTFTVTPTGDGEVTVQIPADAASDAAGNENPASVVYRLTFDRMAPTVTLLTGEQSPTNAQGATFTATFSEPVTLGDGISGIDVTGGAASNLSPSGTASTFTFTVTPTGDGEVTVRISSGAASDNAGNYNTASDAFKLAFDRTAPTVTLLTGEQSPTNAQGATFTATFSEPVTLGDGISGIDVTGGAASNLLPSGTSRTFTFTVTPAGDGEVTVRIPSGVAGDNAGNDNSESNTASLTFDHTVPTIRSLTTNEQSPTNSTDAGFTVTFSEDVTFARDILVTGGTASPARPTGTASSFMFTVTPTSDGVVTVQVPAGTAYDDAGNENPASVAPRLTFDRTDPVITPPGSIRLELGDLYVQPAAACSDAIDSNPAVTVTVDDVDVNQVGVYTLTHACTDDAGNLATATSTVIVFDPSGFATSITSDPASPTSSPSVEFTVIFGEQLGSNTLEASEMEISPPVTISNFASNLGDTYTFTLEGLTDNTYTVTVPQGVVNSTLGSPNSLASIRVTVDHTAPTVTSLTASEQSPTNAQGATFTATFSEPVAFDSGISDISVTGGAASNLSPSGTASSFTFTVTPAGDGEVTVRIPSGVASDNAGNDNLESNTASLTFDHTVPTIQSLTTNEQSPTNSADAEFTVTFSEDVTFARDILVTGGTASPARPTGTASSFTFTVTPAGDGEVTVRIPSGVAGDNAGNDNSESNTASLTFDHTVPTIQSLTTNEQSPTNSADAGFTVTFSEDVTFAGDILVTGGTASPARPTGTASSFTFTVAPTSDGVVTVQVPAGTAHDDAGNENPASVAPKLTFDRTDPVITPPGSIRLELGDLYVQPAAACFDAIDSNPAVTVTVDDVDVNQVGVYTLTHACTDDAGNLATATSTVIVFDPSGFATSITSDPASPTSSPSVEFTVIFGEQLGSNTLEASEMEISPPVTISDFVSNLGDTYTFTLAGLTDNTYTVTVPLGVVNSTLGSPNSLASIRVTVDHTAPTVTSLTASEQSPTNAQGATFTATFSEPVAFDSGISDISVTGGAASNLSPSGTASSFTFTVTPAGDGEVTVRIPSGVAGDNAGNANSESNTASLTFDHTVPTIQSLTTNEQSPTNSADAGFTVTFSEDVTFARDILVTGGTASPARPTGTASSFTFTVTPAGDGEVTVRIPSGVAGDNAGNANSESNTASLTFDHTVPTIQSLTTNEQSPTNSADAGFTVTFSEDVTFARDILVTGGTASPARPTGTASSFTFTVTPAGDGEVTVRIPSGVAGDNAGNANSESNTASLTFDHTVPTIQSLTTNEQSPTNSADAGFTVTFSEDVRSPETSWFGGTASPARPTGTASRHRRDGRSRCGSSG